MSKINIFALLVVLFVVALSSTFFRVNEAEYGMVLRFRQVLTENEKPKFYMPGLHFKIPFVDEILKFDTRLRIIDESKTRITTQEKKDVIVSYYIAWKIDDLYTFYRRTRANYFTAASLLSQKVSSTLKMEIGRLTIKEVVSSERSELMDRTLSISADNAKELGIEVIDVRIKGIDLPSEVSESVYTRMKAERERKANEFRGEGDKEATWIRAEARKKYDIILAEADRVVSETLGQGEAESIKIYASAHNQNPEFYKFLRSMDAYKESFKDKNDIMVLETNSEFLKHFRKG